MGSFSKDIRRLSIRSSGVKTVRLDSIKAQYNPYRFKYWKSLHEGSLESVLDIACSPHVRLLKYYEEQSDIWDQISHTAYYQLQQKYGRKNKWIKEKIRGFLNMYDELKVSPILKSHISVMEKPIRKNPYNDSFEVFEGHHRIACLCSIGIPDITVDLRKCDGD